MKEFPPEKLTEFINGKNKLGRIYLMGTDNGRFRVRFADSPNYLLPHLLENGKEVGLFVEFTVEQLAEMGVKPPETAI